jgi:hypothetical protein
MTMDNRLKSPPNDDIIREHFGYSTDLIAMALRELKEPPHTDRLREWYRQMSIIEVFWTQARLLIEFFDGSAGSQNTSAAAHFMKSRLQFSFDSGDKDIETMMNDQIAHMNTNRTINLDDKFRPEDMWRVGRAIARESDRFTNNLSAKYRDIWDKERVSGHIPIEADSVYLALEKNESACTAPPQIERAAISTHAPELKITGSNCSSWPNSLGGPTGPAGPPR